MSLRGDNGDPSAHGKGADSLATLNIVTSSNVLYRTVNEVAVKAAWAGLKIPMAPVVAPAGMVTRSRESLTTVTLAFFAVPTHANVEPVKPLPFTVTTVPTGPERGEKLLISCCGYAAVPLVTVNEVAVNAT